MFRWWKDKKKPKKERKSRHVEDDYGFRKRAIIVQETVSGHTVIIKDDLNHPNILKFGATCRARMPTPVQNFSETSSHIYDEIPELPPQTRFPSQNDNDNADLIKDARNEHKVDLRNAIEVGPYLIVPIADPTCSNQDVEIFKRNEFHDCSKSTDMDDNCNPDCTCNSVACDDDLRTGIKYSPPWDDNNQNGNQTDISKDLKIVLTRCVRSKSSSQEFDSLQPLCSNAKSEPDLCSFETFLKSDEETRALTESPGAESNSRTLTGTPVSNSRTPIHAQAISNGPSEMLDTLEHEGKPSEFVATQEGVKQCEAAKRLEADGTDDTCCEYDLSTSGESDISGNSDYELYLSKIENNLKLKHNVRKIIESLERTIEEETDDDSSDYHECSNIKLFDLRECSNDRCERDSITYVSSLSEYSSATSHISDISADRSASDDSSGYYECLEDNLESRDLKRDYCVNLNRTASVPGGSNLCSKVPSKKTKHKNHKRKQCQSRSNSFDNSIYKPLSHEQNREMYLLPNDKMGDSDSSSSSTGLRKSKSKPVLTPQPTPVYMDPYRGRSRSHNRLLGDLIRMNYDKQTFIQR